jgi:hypothetical protein
MWGNYNGEVMIHVNGDLARAYEGNILYDI